MDKIYKLDWGVESVRLDAHENGFTTINKYIMTFKRQYTTEEQIKKRIEASFNKVVIEDCFTPFPVKNHSSFIESYIKDIIINNIDEEPLLKEVTYTSCAYFRKAKKIEEIPAILKKGLFGVKELEHQKIRISDWELVYNEEKITVYSTGVTQIEDPSFNMIKIIG
jgi:hypothetical protein